MRIETGDELTFECDGNCKLDYFLDELTVTDDNELLCHRCWAERIEA